MKFLIYHKIYNYYVLGAELNDDYFNLSQLHSSYFRTCSSEKFKVCYESVSDGKIRTAYGYIYIWAGDRVGVEM